MTELNPPGWLQGSSAHTAQHMRVLLGSLVDGKYSATATQRSRGGINPYLGGQFAVAQSGTPDMNVQVSAGVAYIPGTENVNQGVYLCVNDATVALAISTAPGPGLNRIDLVVAKVQDAAYSGVTNAWSLAIVTGTAAASPSAPSAPNNSITLAQVYVGSQVTSITNANITDKRFYSATQGGLIKCSTTSDRPSTTQIIGGQLVYESSTVSSEGRTGAISLYNGSVWQYIFGGAWQTYSPTLSGWSISGYWSNPGWRIVGSRLYFGATLTFNSLPGTWPPSYVQINGPATNNGAPSPGTYPCPQATAYCSWGTKAYQAALSSTGDLFINFAATTGGAPGAGQFILIGGSYEI